MLKIIIKVTSVVFYLLLITGCGGSGGGDAINDVYQDGINIEIADVKPEQIQIASLSMDSLIADKDFTFTNKKQVNMFVDLPEYQQQRGYISLYSVYQQLDSGRYYPDSNSQLVSGALVDGLFEQSFSSNNNQQQYLVEVWLYDGSEPMQKVLLINENELLLNDITYFL